MFQFESTPFGTQNLKNKCILFSCAGIWYDFSAKYFYLTLCNIIQCDIYSNTDEQTKSIFCFLKNIGKVPVNQVSCK